MDFNEESVPISDNPLIHYKNSIFLRIMCFCWLEVTLDVSVRECVLVTHCAHQLPSEALCRVLQHCCRCFRKDFPLGMKTLKE